MRLPFKIDILNSRDYYDQSIDLNSDTHRFQTTISIHNKVKIWQKNYRKDRENQSLKLREKTTVNQWLQIKIRVIVENQKFQDNTYACTRLDFHWAQIPLCTCRIASWHLRSPTFLQSDSGPCSYVPTSPHSHSDLAPNQGSLWSRF